MKKLLDFLKAVARRLKPALPFVGAIVVLAIIWYLGVRMIDWSSVSEGSDAVLPPAVACDQTTPITGDTMTVSKTRRPTILENWTSARSQLVVDTRSRAEQEAKESVDDYIDDIDCPELCPDLNPSGTYSYVTTNTPITGGKGFGYIRYDVSANSQASTSFVCEAPSP
jgi:hypothetical protein